MGKIAKVLLALIVIIAVLLPAVALRQRSLVSDHLQTIAGLEQTLAETREELAETQEDLRNTRQELSDTRDELARTKRDLESARSDISRLEGELRTEKQNRERVEADLRTRTQELSSARAEIRQKDSEINNLNSRISALEREKEVFEEKISEQEEEIETLKRVAGIADLDVEDVPLAEGRAIAAGGGVLTASFRGNLGIMPWTNMYISRRGRIVERVPLRQLHETNVVFEFGGGIVDAVRQGDFVVMDEGENILAPENFEGVISGFRREGFAVIELSEAVFVAELPEISVYRGEELILTAVPERVRSAVTVAEFQVGADTRISRSDAVRAEKQ